MSLAQLLLLRQGGASGTLPLEETCLEMEVGSILALSGLMPGQRWNLCQRLSNELWRRWSQEYLRILNRKTKEQRNFVVVNIVLVKDQQMYQPTWPIARIVEVHPGSDTHVRVVTLRIGRHLYKRPVVKLVPLLEADEPHSPPGGCSDLDKNSTRETEVQDHSS